MEQSSALPWAGEYHGPSQLQVFFDKASEWVAIDVRNPEIFESSGSDKIVVLSRIHLDCVKTDQRIDFPMSQTFVMDLEQGKIKEIRTFYWDIDKLNETMGYKRS